MFILSMKSWNALFKGKVKEKLNKHFKSWFNKHQLWRHKSISHEIYCSRNKVKENLNTQFKVGPTSTNKFIQDGFSRNTQGNVTKMVQKVFSRFIQLFLVQWSSYAWRSSSTISELLEDSIVAKMRWIWTWGVQYCMHFIPLFTFLGPFQIIFLHNVFGEK